MRVEKITLTLPSKLVVEIDQYQRAQGLDSREDVIELAMSLLRDHARDTEDEADVEDDFEETEDELDVTMEMGHGVDQDDDRW